MFQVDVSFMCIIPSFLFSILASFFLGGGGGDLFVCLLLVVPFLGMGICMSSVWIYIISCICVAGHCLSGQLSFMHGKNFNIGQYSQSFQPMFFIPAMLIGTIDFYHFIPLSVTLIMAEVHKVSSKQDLLALFTHTFFQQNGMKFGMVMKQFKLNILWLLLNEHFFYQRK